MRGCKNAKAVSRPLLRPAVQSANGLPCVEGLRGAAGGRRWVERGAGDAPAESCEGEAAEGGRSTERAPMRPAATAGWGRTCLAACRQHHAPTGLAASTRCTGRLLTLNSEYLIFRWRCLAAQALLPFPQRCRRLSKFGSSRLSPQVVPESFWEAVFPTSDSTFAHLHDVSVRGEECDLKTAQSAAAPLT